jgi:hypothetical protein
MIFEEIPDRGLNRRLRRGRLLLLLLLLPLLVVASLA